MNVYFNGTKLNESFLLSDVSRPLPSMSADTVSVPGLDGAIFRDATYKAGNVSFSLWPHEMSQRELRSAVRGIASALSVREPAPLSFSDDDGLYYMAIPDGSMPVREYADAFCVECSFILPSPVMYGSSREVVIPSGGSATVFVGGTYPARLSVSAAAARRGAGNLWGLRVDGGDYSRVSIPTSAGTAVSIDAESRTARVAGAASLITLDSDWIELEPGEHVISNDVGSGASTASWIERWL